MSVFSVARAQCDAQSLIILMLVEKLRHGGEPAHATAIASHIKGAPIADVDRVLDRLTWEVGVLDRVLYRDPDSGRMPKAYRVNPLGAEVLNAEVEGWTPSELEQSARDSQMASAQAGRTRQ